MFEMKRFEKKYGVFMIEKKDKIKKEMNWKYYNKIVFYFFHILGSILALYVGGWVMFLHAAWIAYLAFMAGTLTLIKALLTVVSMFFSVTVIGGIWSLGYMIGRKLEKKSYGRELL